MYTQALQAWHADEVAKSASPKPRRQGAASGSPAKRQQPSQPQLQSPAKRRLVEPSARTTRSRAAQQGTAPAACSSGPKAGSPVRSLVSDSEDSFCVHISDDDTSEEEHEPAEEPGPSQRRSNTAGIHTSLPCTLTVMKECLGQKESLCLAHERQVQDQVLILQLWCCRRGSGSGTAGQQQGAGGCD